MRQCPHQAGRADGAEAEQGEHRLGGKIGSRPEDLSHECSALDDHIDMERTGSRQDRSVAVDHEAGRLFAIIRPSFRHERDLTLCVRRRAAFPTIRLLLGQSVLPI